MKKIQILIITLVIILVLGCTIFAVLYFATDVFKSDKEMFYKYMSQMNLEDIDLENYISRIGNEVNSNEGQISIKLQMEDELIDESFEFTTQSDPLNDIASAKININQDGEKKLTIDYLKNEDLHGLKFEDIVNQYIVLENNNLKDFAQKFGVENAENILNKIENNETIVDNQKAEQIEELKKIYSKYINVAIGQIPNENYSKVKKGNITVGNKTIEADGYQVTISNKELKKILLKILDTIKDDEQVFNLINKINTEENGQIDFEEYTSTIEMEKNDLLEVDDQENSINLSIIVYKQGDDVVKIYYKLSIEEESFIVSIEKIENEMNLNLNVAMCDGSESYNLNINLSIKDLKSQNVETSAIINVDTLNTDMDSSITVEYNNTTSFNSDIEIEEFNSRNHTIINEFSSDQIENLVVNLYNKIYEKIDKEKAIFGLLSVILISDGMGEKEQDALEQERELVNSIEEQSAEISMSNQAREMFNAKFSIYEGLQNGTSVKMMIQTIENNNLNNAENKVEYTPISVDSNTRYNISFEKDENGYINKAIIEEQ